MFSVVKRLLVVGMMPAVRGTTEEERSEVPAECPPNLDPKTVRPGEEEVSCARTITSLDGNIIF